MGQTWDPAKQRYVAAGSTKSAEQIALEQAEAEAATAARQAARYIRGRDLDPLVPGAGEVIVGGASGPVGRAFGAKPYRARSPRISKMVSAMQPGHGWTRISGTGTVADDTSVFVLGSQSLRIATDTTSTVVRKTGLGPIDATGKDVLIWFRIDRPEAVSEATLYVSSDNFTGFAFRGIDMPTPPLPFARPNEWVAITLPQATFGTTGTVNWAALTGMQFRLVASSGTITAYIGGIALVDRAAKPVVSITIDDGYADLYTVGRPVFSKYGFPATCYLITDVVGTSSGWVSLAQAQELRDLYGWEFAAHAGTLANHDATFPGLTEDQIAADFEQCQDWLRRNGFADGVNHLAYPKGAYDTKTLRQVRAHFASARSTSERYPETHPAGDPYRLRTYNVANTRTPANVQTAIDQAIAGNGWLILCFHHFVASGQASSSNLYPVDNLDTIMAYIAGAGVEVRTVGDVIRNGV